METLYWIGDKLHDLWSKHPTVCKVTGVMVVFILGYIFGWHGRGV